MAKATPKEIYRRLTEESVELQVARSLYVDGATESSARAMFKEKPLSDLPEPVSLKVFNHLRDLIRGIHK